MKKYYTVGCPGYSKQFKTKKEALQFIEDCLVEDLLSRFNNEDDITKKIVEDEIQNYYYINEISVSVIHPKADKYVKLAKESIREWNKHQQNKEEELAALSFKMEHELYLKLKKKFGD